jgi:putative multiple sugar transport system permease protein
MATQETQAPAPVRPPSSEDRASAVGFLLSRLRQIGIFIALIIIVLLFQALTQGNLLTPRNVTSIINQNAYVLILAIGMVMIIIAGHIDLSVGSVAGRGGSACWLRWSSAG